MKIFNKQNNNFSKWFTSHSNISAGFTLIETMVAVFILTTTVMSLLSLTTSSLFAAKYANNEITANYLLQEAVDYIRNDRDSVVFQQVTNGGDWGNFIAKYGDPNSKTLCFSNDGCSIDVFKNIYYNNNESTFSYDNNQTFSYNTDPDKYSTTSNNFYTYSSGEGTIPTTFKRKINMKLVPISGNNDELDVIVTVDWMNGNLARSRSLKTSLLNWQK